MKIYSNLIYNNKKMNELFRKPKRIKLFIKKNKFANEINTKNNNIA
jgi:hypothetical protein